MEDPIYLYTKTSIVETSWAELKVNPSMVSTGDLIPFALKNGEEVAVRAMHDGSGKLFFVLENCLSQKRCMNPTFTTHGGWKACEMRRWLNEKVFALLPDDLQKAIVTTNIVATGPRGGKANAKDRLFLLSYKQVFGVGRGVHETPQEQLDWFAEKSRRIKLDSDGTPSLWWLRSAFNGKRFNSVNGRGCDGDSSNLGPYGVAFGFCLLNP